MINIKQFIDRVIRFQKGLETHFVITLIEEDNKYNITVNKTNAPKGLLNMPLRITVTKTSSNLIATNSWNKFLHYILFEK